MHNFSYYLVLGGVFITSMLYSQNTVNQHRIVSGFGAPLDIPMILSGNYGEIRSAGFHAGIDIKTAQVEGKNVLAAETGYIFRIGVHSGGYGNALYMKHPGGKVSVYAHLSMFMPAIEKYVKEQQYRKQSFEIDLYPDTDLFVFQKGSFLGYSGNSGSSEGPHLHFEIRDKTASVPLNALNYGFAIQDKINPGINWLAIYPIDPQSSVNGSGQKLILPVSSKNGNYTVNPGIIDVNGKIGVGIETYDFLDYASNECSPYSLSLSLDENLLFLCRIDSIPFSAAGYVKSHIDYEESLRSGKKIQKLFVDPNNKLKIYKVAVDRGIIQLKDTAVHTIRIIVRDTYGNESALKFSIRSVGTSGEIFSKEEDPLVVTKFFYDSLNVYENRDIRISLPRDALFDNINFQYVQQGNDGIMYSRIHQVHNEYTPLFKPYILSIRPRELPESPYAKMLIAWLDSKGNWVSQGGEYKNGFVTAKVKLFGEFIVTVDTIPPVIRPVTFTSGGKYEKNQTISFNITDSISGIRKFTGLIDKKWVLFEYDAKNDLLTYEIDAQRLESNKTHTLEIYVYDNKDNSGYYKAGFFY